LVSWKELEARCFVLYAICAYRLQGVVHLEDLVLPEKDEKRSTQGSAGKQRLFMTRLIQFVDPSAHLEEGHV